ncbi:MAG: hypothetical protein QNJ72_29855 [Pleurocapsa sp. MO_226.B13]|nr:hypothetical protein [Pleurocapsa sp. MO_226.B13]
MSKDKDRTNDQSKIYPSEYIDFTPNSTKSNRLIKTITIAIIIAVFLIVLYSLIPFPSDPTVSINKVEQIDKIVNELENSLNNLKIKLDHQKSSQISEKELREIIKIDIDLKDTVNNLQKIKRELARGEYSQISEKELREIIKIDNKLEYTMNGLQKIKMKLEKIN